MMNYMYIKFYSIPIFKLLLKYFYSNYIVSYNICNNNFNIIKNLYQRRK